MIPNFKTYLKESIWMNIHKRSNNELDRKEEDINLLNDDAFIKYLNSLYDADIKKQYDSTSKYQGITITFARSKNTKLFKNWPVSLIYYTDFHMLSFSNKRFDGLCPHLYQELIPILNIETDNEGFKFIVPDDNKKVDNKFVLYVLETIIEHLDPNEEEITIFKK